jgi:hypothetical protein
MSNFYVGPYFFLVKILNWQKKGVVTKNTLEKLDIYGENRHGIGRFANRHQFEWHNVYGNFLIGIKTCVCRNSNFLTMNFFFKSMFSAKFNVYFIVFNLDCCCHVIQ